MARSFKLPDLGEGIHEGEVLAVLVSVGDEVKEGDPILEMETDKAAVEIPSPFTGSVKEILVKPGDLVNVGDVLMTFSDGEEAEPAEVELEKPVEKPPEPAEKAEPAEVAEEKPTEKPPEPAEPVPVKPEPSGVAGPVPASPATRRLARELGVDLGRVSPSGGIR
jgi:pyruvate dehydrogenase E2 component (dihydrolipoamide acetyltransferase)